MVGFVGIEACDDFDSTMDATDEGEERWRLGGGRYWKPNWYPIEKYFDDYSLIMNLCNIQELHNTYELIIYNAYKLLFQISH